MRDIRDEGNRMSCNSSSKARDKSQSTCFKICPKIRKAPGQNVVASKGLIRLNYDSEFSPKYFNIIHHKSWRNGHKPIKLLYLAEGHGQGQRQEAIGRSSLRAALSSLCFDFVAWQL